MPTRKVKVGGIAVRAGLSLNGILYIPEELAKFAPTLSNKPFLKDHLNTTDNTIGLVTESTFNNATAKVLYEAWIKEDGSGIIEKINDGRIKEVSIGAVVGRLVKENLDDDFFIAKDMKAMELSTTPTPAVAGTSISQTLRGLIEAVKPEDLKKVKPIFETVQLINENFNVLKENKKVIERFICPLCENELESIENLRKHMKVHNEEPREADYEEKYDKKTKNNREEIKMSDDTKIEVKIDTKEVEAKLKEVEAKLKEVETRETKLKEQETQVKQKEDEVKSKEDTIAKEKREALDKEYAKVAEEKKVTPRDISKLSDETVSELVEQLKLIEDTEPEKVDKPEEETEDKPEETPEKKNETKGKVSTEKKDDDTNLVLDGYKITKSEFGSGFALYQESYDKDKYKRLTR